MLGLIKKIVKPFLSLLLILLGLKLLVLWIGLIFGGSALLPFVRFFSPGPALLGYLGIFSGWMTIGIPILALLLLIARRFGPYRLKRSWRKGMWAFWTINALTFIGLAAQMGLHQKFRFESEEVIALNAITTDTVNIRMKHVDFEHGLLQLDDLYYEDGTLKSENIGLRIEPSANGKLELKKYIRSFGKSERAAEKHAKQVEAKVMVNEDGITLPGHFSLTRGEKFRGQRVRFVLHVPQGVYLDMQPDVRYFIHRRSFDSRFDIPSDMHTYRWTIDQEGLVSEDWIRKNNYETILDYDGIEQVNVEGRFVLDLVKGERDRIRIVGKEEAAKDVDIVRQGDRLSIIAANHQYGKPLNLYAELRDLSALHLKGTEDVRLEGFDQEKMEIVNNGHGDIKAFVDVQELKVRLEGRNELSIIGSGETLNLHILDGAKVDAERYQVRLADVSGRLRRITKLNAAEEIRFDAANGTYLKVYGEPNVVLNDEHQ